MILSVMFAITSCLLCRGRRPREFRRLGRRRVTCDVRDLAVFVRLELVADGVALLHGLTQGAASEMAYGLIPSMECRNPRTSDRPAFLAASSNGIFVD